jgi:hypothetical protein
VVSVNATETIPAGRFTGCLHRRDRDLRRGGGTTIRVFCPGVGLAGVRTPDGLVVLVRYRRARG